LLALLAAVSSHAGNANSRQEQSITVADCVPFDAKKTDKKGKPCRMTLRQIQERERDILDKDWRLVRAVLPELTHAKALSVLDRDLLQGKHEAVCEALREDLVNGNYGVFRTPEIASARDGFQAYVDGVTKSERGCEARDSFHASWGPNQSEQFQSDISSLWFQPLGIMSITRFENRA
jgi:hypothetical protein